MMQSFEIKAAQFQQKHRRIRYWRNVVISLSLVVALVTTNLLILPAKTLESDTICGKAEHEHTNACYQTVLVCELPESDVEDPGHTHDETCIAPEQELVLVCTEDEWEAHTHDESCYGNVCGKDETEGHEHTGDCYTSQEKQICGKDETEGHAHDNSCYTEVEHITCGETEREGHTHSAGCYTTVREKTCTDESEEHEHSDSCYAEHEERTCGKAEREGHTHTADCRTTETQLTCGKDECEAHTHDGSCFTTEDALTCTETECEPHTHDQSCNGLTCEKREGEGHTHTDENCREWQDVYVCGETERDPVAIHEHTEECYEEVLTCTIEEHTHDESCQPMIFGAEPPKGFDNEYIDDNDDERYTIAVYAPDGVVPEGAKLEVELIEEGTAQYQAVETALNSQDELVIASQKLNAAEIAVDEEPIDEEIVEEEPIDEEPVDEEPVDEEPVDEEPVDEEPIDEEIVEEEPVDEEIIETVERTDYDGMVAMDIHFVDETGAEVKLNGQVFVSMNLTGLLPQDVDRESVSVQHIREVQSEQPEQPAQQPGLLEQLAEVFTDTAEEIPVEAVEIVADSSDETGFVEITENEDEAALDVETGFLVDSFSSFVITYKNTADGVLALDREDLYSGLTTENRHSATYTMDSFGRPILTATGNDPYLYIDFPEDYSINPSKDEYRYAVITYAATGLEQAEWCMQMFPVSNHNHINADGSYVANSDTIKNTNGAFKQVVVDLQKANFNQDMKGFRFDFIAGNSHASVTVESIVFCADPEVGKAWTWADDEARGDDITDNSVENITFRLFDYDKQLINSGEIQNYFTFRNSDEGDNGTKEYYTHGDLANPQTDVDGFTKNHATVLPKLGADGAPVFDATRGSSTATKDYSLGYLFGTDSHSGVWAYTPNNTILRQNGTQYTYDSQNNAVDFESTSLNTADRTGEGTFHVRGYAERNSTTAGYAESNGDPYSDFMPFSYTEGVKLGTKTSDYHIKSADVNYWYGMTMEFTFRMHENGQVMQLDANGNPIEGSGVPMIFSFSGDDDVWVFIDDVLVMDLGGTHGTVDGKIDFSTGEVQQYLTWGGKTAANTATSFPTTIKTRFDAANVTPNGGWNENNDQIFADYSTHTLKFFYLERGAAVANCSLDFNMPIVPDFGLAVTKNLADGKVDPETEYDFRLMKGEQPMTGVEYAISVNNSLTGETGTTDANTGIFSLNAGETAIFHDMITNVERFGNSADHGYMVQEILDGAVKELYSKVAYKASSGSGEYEIDLSDAEDEICSTGKLDAEARQDAIFTNHVTPGELTIEKIAMFDDNPVPLAGTPFPFTLTSTELAGESFNQGKVAFNDDGVAEITVFAGEENAFTISGLPAGAKITVAEGNHDGYAAYWWDATVDADPDAEGIEGAYVVGYTARPVYIIANGAETVRFLNKTGAVLPNTGGIGTTPYYTFGTLLVLCAGAALILRRKEEDQQLIPVRVEEER